MQPNEIIQERVEFLKLEYQHLQSHQEHLENAEWKVAEERRRVTTGLHMGLHCRQILSGIRR